MSTTNLVPLSAISVRTSRPTYAYRALPAPAIQASAAELLLRCGMPAILKTAVIVSAKVWVNQTTAWTGANTLHVQRNAVEWLNSVTWDTKPGVTDTDHTLTQTGTAAGTWWGIDVTADVQGFISGTKHNAGWRLSTSSGTLHQLRGSNAPILQPYLEIVYDLPAKVPTDLSPQGGAVSTDKPVLTFSAGDDVTAIQVQIDPAADGVSPAFDSGTVAEIAGVLDLTTTAYAGLADSTSTFWRARAQTALGWSDWCQWVTFSRTDLGTLALTAPGSTTADGTPPFTWTFTGTQVSWQATLLDSTGKKVLADSGYTLGTATGWTPGAGLVASGTVGIARIRVWDDVIRNATPGLPAYTEQSVTFTFTTDGTVTAMTTLTASQVPGNPGVNLAGTRAAGVPDEVVIYRDAVQIARMPGTDVFSGTDFTWTDWTVPMNQPVVYRVAPVVSSHVAAGGPTVDVTPSCVGLWLVDPETGDAARLDGADAGTFDQTDLATVHQPIAPGTVPIRRRLRRGVLSGTITGEIIDAVGFAALDTIELLDVTFPGNDASNLYRLIAGHKNIPVIAGDFLVSPSSAERPGVTRAHGQFNFWASA